MGQRSYGVIIGFISGILVMLYLVLIPNGKDESPALVPGQIFNTTQAYILPVTETSYLPILDGSASLPNVAAKSALVYDSRSGRVLYNKSIKTKLPVASLTKLMTAVLAVEQLDGQDIVTVPATAVKVDEEKQTLYADEQLTVESLIKMMLIESSNDAAYALAHQSSLKNFDLVAEMNRKAKFIGMSVTTFKDPAGLNDEGYSTVEDLAKLVQYSFRHTLIWNTLSQSEIKITSIDGKIEHQVKSTNQLLGAIKNIAGGKTGYTEGALGCMILVVDIPQYEDKIITIVLGSTERFTDTKKLIDWTLAAYRWK